MAIQEKCRILDHQKVGSRHFKLTLVSKYISSHAQPGQFAQVKCSESHDPLLRRPISFHKISAEHDTFELLYEVVGKGTELLTKYFVGEDLDLFGPLGEGFKPDPAKKIHIFVGGGMGVAPLKALAEKFKGQAVYILMGAKTKELVVCENDFKKITDQVQVSTDDGSYGKKGFISDLMLEFINDQLTASSLQLAAIYSCGPRAMLKAVAEIAFQKRIDCQVSMEERMACGVGACKGCPVKTTAGYKMVCKDGPVFDSKEIVW